MKLPPIDRALSLTRASDLAAALRSDEPPVVIDCRFDLQAPSAGRAAWEQGHIQGAFYADLDCDLAAPIQAESGRHPLPEPDRFARVLASWGLEPGRQIVAYDASGGAIAARLWWLLHWAGHHKVTVLDGGLPAWQSSMLPLDTAQPALRSGRYPLSPGSVPVIHTDELMQLLDAGRVLLLDARDARRFAGEVEPIDPVAGHIPGAVNYPFQSSLTADSRFREAPELAAGFRRLLGQRSAEAVVSMCGSGVTACHTILAFAAANLLSQPDSRWPALYAGSWSEWIADNRRPVASGSE